MPWAAARKKTGYLRSQFLRLKSRRGPKKAIMAVAASMLTAVYYMLSRKADYTDVGADHFDRRDKAKVAARAVLVAAIAAADCRRCFEAGFVEIVRAPGIFTSASLRLVE